MRRRPVPHLRRDLRGRGVCGALEDPNLDQQCGCFASGKTCGGTCSFACTTHADCNAKLPGSVSETAGACPAGGVCSVAIAEVYTCLPTGTCVLVTAMCQ